MVGKAKDKSQAGVSATLTACGLQTDVSSRNISEIIIADNLASGAKGAAEITHGARGINDSVGSCVANYYDDKKPSAWEKISGLVDTFKSAASGVAAAASELKNDISIKPFQGVTDVERYNSRQTPDNRI